MSNYESEVLTVDPWKGQNAPHASTEGNEVEPGQDVFELITEILGYDPVEQALMAEGYRESAAEFLAISESNLASAYETFPSENSNS